MKFVRPTGFAVAVALGAMTPAQVIWDRFPLYPDGSGGHQRMAWDGAGQRVMLVNDAADVWTWAAGAWTRTRAQGFSVPATVGLAHDLARQRAVMFRDGETWEWDGTGWTQRFPANSPSRRSWHRMVYDAARGRTLLFGGQVGTTYLNDTWQWDGIDWAELQPATRPTRRTRYAMAYDATRARVVLYGGVPSLGDTWEWTGQDWEQQLPLRQPGPRWAHDMAYDPARQRMVLYGGVAGSTISGDTWEWDGTDWSERLPTKSPPIAFGHSMAYDASRRRVVVFTGGVSSETWEYDGVTWNLFLTPRPSVTTGAAMAYDSARRRAVLFGGFDSRVTPLDETWEWSGSGWAMSGPATVPCARVRHAMTYDAARGRALMFGGGGCGAPTSLADTWEWDGIDWAQRLPTTSPAARESAAIAFDEGRQRVVLFGGGSTSAVFADTWEWDGNTWLEMAPAQAPPNRSGSNMTYDAARQRIVLFGGNENPASSAGLRDTWEWDGSNWTRRNPATTPPPRHAHMMAYDRDRQRIVMTGGQHNTTFYSDTWEWDGNAGDWIERFPALGSSAPFTNSRNVAVYDETKRRVLLVDDRSDVWEYYTSAPAAYAVFGTGCAGLAGMPALSAPAGLPWATERFRVRFAPLPAGQPAVVLFGVSNTFWAGSALPIPLGSLGRPDCNLLVSPDLALPVTPMGGVATLATPAPGAALAGQAYFNQGLTLDLAAGPAGLAVSAAARATIGLK